MDGSLACSRLGCDEPAVAVFAFDARECLVWLDPLGADCRGAGVLCAAHADRLSPPHGWNLLDRRAVESRLWIGRPATTPSRVVPTGSRTRVAKAHPCVSPGPSLPFDEPAPRHAEPPRTPWSPHDRPGPEFERVLDARGPLLARAFEAARPTDDAK